MTDLTDEQRRDLNIARGLAEAGVPVFVAHPARNQDGSWNPHGGTDGCGYFLPKEWQKTTPRPNFIDAWQPGCALLAVAGSGLDVVDIDPRNGGSLASMNGTMPTTYGTVTTPSGGLHLGIRSLGVQKFKAADGIDVQAGGGCVFLPPTRRASQVDDQVREYRYVEPYDVAALAAAVDDRSGEALAAMARRSPTPDSASDLLMHEGTPLSGAIVKGDRDDVLTRYAARLAALGLPRIEAERLLRARWAECEQVAGDEFTWEAARSKLDTAWAKFHDGERVVQEVQPSTRQLVLTSAADIAPKVVRWLWAGRMALGTLALLAGREGLGKSTLAYWLIAQLTRGLLPGEHQGAPRAVLVCATEDSWAHVIVPRLMAAGADLSRVYRVEIVTEASTFAGSISLPLDIVAVEQAARQVDAAMLLMDPLMSRLDPTLDAHRDGEVRRALEPLAALADRTGLVVLGLIHLNKTGSTDVLDRVMASKAFVAVARSVSVVVPDPDDETGRRRLFGTPKNNLGRDDLPSIGFTVDGAKIEAEDGMSEVGRIVIGDESGTSIREAMERTGEDPDVRTVTADAKQWLREYLTEHYQADSKLVKRDAVAAGFKDSTLQRARRSLRVHVERLPVSPPKTTWSLPTDRTFNGVIGPGESE